MDDSFIISQGGNKHPKKNTRGWELLNQMRERFSKWVTLKNHKESNPFELTNYEVENKIDHEPDFAWWVTLTLQNE